MPVAAGLVKFEGGPGLGVEVAPAEARFGAPNLNETFAVTIEGAVRAPAGDEGGYSSSHGPSLAVGEHPRFGKGEAHGEWDAGDVAYGVDTGEPGFHRVAVHRHPASLSGHTRLRDDGWSNMRRHVDQEVEMGLCLVGETQCSSIRVHLFDLMLRKVGDIAFLD